MMRPACALFVLTVAVYAPSGAGAPAWAQHDGTSVAGEGASPPPDDEFVVLDVRAERADAPPQLAVSPLPHADDIAQCFAFEEALAQAVENDPRIAEAVSQFDIQRAELSLTRASRFPQLESFSRAGLGNGLEAENQIDNRLGVRLSQRVFGFGAGRFERRAASARADEALHDVDAARGAVAIEAAEAYMALLRARARREATLEIEKFYARDAEMARRRLDRNLLTISEANTIFAELAQAEAQRAREDLRIAQETERLRSLLGAPFACGEEASLSAFLDLRLPESLELAAGEAVSRSPALNAARAAIRSARAESRRAGRAALPQLSVGGVVTYDYDDVDNRFERNERVGFDISAPLFEGGRNRFAKRSAEARARRAEAGLAREERALREHLAVSWARAFHLRTVLVKQIVARDSFAKLSAAAEREFELGALTAPELVDVKRDYYTAVLTEIDVRFELYAQELSLIADAGRLIAEAPAPY